MLFKLYYSKNKVVYVESLLHQLINDDFDQDSFFKDILILYGNPKIKFIFLDCSVNDSIDRLLKRGDNIIIDSIILKRYIKAYNTHKYLYKIACKKYKFLKNIEKPLLLDSTKNTTENVKHVLLNINY